MNHRLNMISFARKFKQGYHNQIVDLHDEYKRGFLGVKIKTVF